MRGVTYNLVLIGSLSIAGIAAAQGPPAARRPNIVLIMADDMGFSDLGCYGSEIRTPHLDRLAERGLRFTHFYNAARCCPTRAALLTGLYPHQAGVGHMVGDRGLPGYRGYLNDQCVTIAEVLHPAGYRTLMVGKWHVGEQRPHWPIDRGFDRYYGLISGGANYFDPTGSRGRSPDIRRVMARDDQPIYPKPGTFYLTDVFSEEAVAFIDEYGRKEAPFFLYIAYTAPHWPLHAWPEDIERYQGKYMDGWDDLRKKRHQRLIEMGLVDARWPLTPRDVECPAWSEVENREELDLKMAVYAAQIDRMDQGIGRIMDKLREVGAEENTLVMFLIDNGGCAEGGPFGFDWRQNGLPPGGADSYMSYGQSWANASNAPFRLYKHWVHEGGIATPLIAYWPAVIEAPRITHKAGHVIDLMATCADVAGAAYPARYKDRDILPCEGRSLIPIFTGTADDWERTLFWEHEGNRAVRQGPWKLVSRYPGDWELYDLEADRTELHNLAERQPAKVRKLAGLYDAWARRCQVMPWETVTGR